MIFFYNKKKEKTENLSGAGHGYDASGAFASGWETEMGMEVFEEGVGGREGLGVVEFGARTSEAWKVWAVADRFWAWELGYERGRRHRHRWLAANQKAAFWVFASSLVVVRDWTRSFTCGVPLCSMGSVGRNGEVGSRGFLERYTHARCPTH